MPILFSSKLLVISFLLLGCGKETDVERQAGIDRCRPLYVKDMRTNLCFEYMCVTGIAISGCVPCDSLKNVKVYEKR